MQSPIPACPTCERLNKSGYRGALLRSSVAYQCSESTLMGGGEAFRGEDGQHHVHDPNWMTSRYQCSLGHQFRTVSQHACPSCDFGREPSKVYEGNNTVAVR